MKTIPDFEKEIQQIDGAFTLMVNPNHPEMTGVYWKGAYCFAIPSNNIYDEPRKAYTNSIGLPHRTREQALAMANKFSRRFHNEAGFYELMTEKL